MGHVSQVYWPKSLLDRSHGGGYVIGFNVNSLVVVVVGVRETITEDLIPRHRLLDRILAETGGPPKVLGYLKGTRAKQGQDSNKVVDKQADLWFVFDQNPANKWPVLTGVYCYGYLHTSSPQIVFYDQPKHRNQLVYSSEALSIFPSTPDQYHPVQQDAKAEELGIDLTLKQVTIPSPDLN